jgi:hypothetical protein
MSAAASVKPRRWVLLVVGVAVVLAACGDDAAGAGPATTEERTGLTLALTAEEQAWWCASLTEAQAWGMNPADYAEVMKLALETGATNAPVESVEEAAAHLRSLSCEADFSAYARQIAARLLLP